MSGIIFAGCSFTHGHGLWYYDRKIYGKYSGDDEIIKLKNDRPIHHFRYKDIFRFPRLVSHELECFEVTKLTYSGNDEDSVAFINHVFDEKSDNSNWTHEHYRFDEIKYIVLQTSRPERCHYETPTEKIRISDDDEKIYEFFKKYNIVDYDDYEKKLVHQLFEKIKQVFIYYEKRGIIPLIFNWTNHYNNLIQNDSYMSERKINISYENKDFTCLEDVIEFDEKLLIVNDVDFFGENPPKDFHPSKKFHRVIADSIINKIRFIEKSNLSNPPLNYI